MKRYRSSDGAIVENPKLDAFLADIQAVFLKHGLEIRHEDEHGLFEIWPLSSRPSFLGTNLDHAAVDCTDREGQGT